MYENPAETGLYYLQTRYYAPEMGRFINADAFVSTGQGILGNNMFAYCGNEPIGNFDPYGQSWDDVKNFFSRTWNRIKNWAKGTFGAESSSTVTTSKVETSIIPDPFPITVKIGEKTTETICSHGDSSKPISVYADNNIQNPLISSSAGVKINVKNFTLDLSIGFDDIGIYGSSAIC